MSAKILLVEDNEANRYLATFLLENSGFTVVHASNGAEAVVAAQNEMPDLILMDIRCPRSMATRPRAASRPSRISPTSPSSP